MPFFTVTESNLSTIIRVERIEKDGVHQNWVFAINDEDGNYYDWKDTELGASASNDEQRIAIHNFLTTKCNKKPAKPIIIKSTNTDIINTTVGATGP